LKNIKLFFWVIFFQIFILNNIQFSGYINPYYYIIFILSISNKHSKAHTLLMSFFLGLSIDIFSYSYGLHAFSSVLIGYLKILWNSKINSNMELDEDFDINSLNLHEFIITSSCFIFIHHFSLFFLELFSFSELMSVLKSTFMSGFFTLILLIIHNIFSFRKI